MSWENNVYLVEEDPPMNRTDPVVKMALTPSAYRRLPEEIEGHIAEFLLPRKIPAGTRGKKYRSPQAILKERRLKKEIMNKGKAYTERAEKRAYENWLASPDGRAAMAALADQHDEFLRLDAERREDEAERVAEEEQARWEEVERAPISPTSQRERLVAKSRARRGQNYNFRPYTHKKSQNKSKKPSKPTTRMRTKSRKQKSNENNHYF